MRSLRHLGIIAFIFICFLSIIFVINQTVTASTEHQLKVIVQERAEAISTLAYNAKTNTFNDLSNLTKFVSSIESDITLYSTDGQVLYSSLENPHVYQKIPDTRFTIIDHRYEYVSPIGGTDHPNAYLVLFGNAPRIQGLSILDIIIFIIGLVVIFIYIQIIRRLTSPLEEATQMAEALAVGNYKKRTYEEHPFDVSGRLGKSLNQLARNLEKMTVSYQEQRDQLRTLIDNLGSGLIFIDDTGFINLVNKTFRQTFDLGTSNWFERHYNQVIHDKKIVELIDETIMVETTLRKQIDVLIGTGKKFFDVYSAPILDSNKRIRGVVLVFHDITELKKLEQVRKDFVANVSHELKTPITSITGFAETLLDGEEVDNDLRLQFLSIIHKESLRLQELIHDLLELSKIEQEKLYLYWDHVDLNQLIHDTVLILNEKAKNKEINIHVQAEQHLTILGDSARLQQILINLLNNAITYTPAQGEIWLKLIEAGNKVKVIVKDSGIGIDPEHLPRIFERFYRVDKARSRNSGGTGLGLAIVKHLVDVHGGSIDVESEFGEGTTFTITFNKE